MKALLNKEHHCYKMYASVLKSSPYPPFLDTPFMDYPFPILQENLELHPFYDFSKNWTPYKYDGIHTMMVQHFFNCSNETQRRTTYEFLTKFDKLFRLTRSQIF